jgi:transcriptional regulator with XRE-family HTH domain
VKTKSCRCCGGSGKEVDSAALGAELRQGREAKGLTQDWVATQMRVSNTYLSELERGGRRWNEDLLSRFRKACS